MSDQLNNTVSFDNLKALLIRNNNHIDFSQIKNHDAVIIDGTDSFFIEHSIRLIRKHFESDIYLKPVFLLKNNRTISTYITELTDGIIFDLDNLSLLSETINNIFLKTKDFANIKSISFEAEVITKTINLLVSRDKKSLFAIPSIASVIGYNYPELSINLDTNDESQVFEILNTAENEGLFTSEFVDRTYLCTNCKSGFLSYREVCPMCSSSNSETEDLVHHFPCAYIGPLNDFKNSIDENLNCPKCNKTLRHIGVDYDKPSSLHTCLECNHQYQDYNVKAKCIKCSFDNQIEHLTAKEIRNYTLTKKGETVAYKGYINTSKDIETVEGAVKYDVFKIMLKYEIERLRQNDYTSNIGFLHLSNAGEIYSRIGMERQNMLFTEMIKILRHNLRSSDFISFYDVSTLIVSMNEIPTKVISKILKEIADLTKRLLKKTFTSINIEIETYVQPLNIETDHDVQLNQLIKQIGTSEKE